MRIGILGGTFDPIHRAHISIATAALCQYKLDEVWFMPAGDPYFKADSQVTPAELRLAMTKACIDAYGEPAFQCSDFEIHDHGHTYTSETFLKLNQSHPLDDFYFILGLDSLEALDTWHEPGLLFKNAVILCALRSREMSSAERLEKSVRTDEKRFETARNHLIKKYASSDPRIEKIDCPEVFLSSTMIRAKAAAGEDLLDYVTPAVAKFIREHHLYS